MRLFRYLLAVLMCTITVVNDHLTGDVFSLDAFVTTIQTSAHGLVSWLSQNGMILFQGAVGAKILSLVRVRRAGQIGDSSQNQTTASPMIINKKSLLAALTYLSLSTVLTAGDLSSDASADPLGVEIARSMTIVTSIAVFLDFVLEKIEPRLKLLVFKVKDWTTTWRQKKSIDKYEQIKDKLSTKTNKTESHGSEHDKSSSK